MNEKDLNMKYLVLKIDDVNNLREDKRDIFWSLVKEVMERKK